MVATGPGGLTSVANGISGCNTVAEAVLFGVIVLGAIAAVVSLVTGAISI
jgi:hypothetical protein